MVRCTCSLQIKNAEIFLSMSRLLQYFDNLQVITLFLQRPPNNIKSRKTQ